MAKLSDARYVAHTGATVLADKTKQVYRKSKRNARYIMMAFKLALKSVWKTSRFVVFLVSHLAITLTVLTVLICVYGVVTVIVADQLAFCLNPDEMNSGNNSIVIDIEDESQMSLAMAQALDLEKIASFYEQNTAGFQSWYEDFRITTLPNERPAKNIELYLLLNEIYSRPEINGESFKYPVNIVNAIGSMKFEARAQVLGLGEGERLFDSELEYYINGSGYCDPLGCPPGIWSSNLEYSGYSHIGCTFISQYEYPALADEQRAIYGGGGNIEAANAYYITSEELCRRDDMIAMTTSDDAFKYLNTIRLSNNVLSRRGFTTWLPDALYTYAYVDRISTEGRNRDTHNYSSSYHDSGNIAALEELQEQLNLTDKQCGDIASMLYCGDRNFHSSIDAFPNYEGISELPSKYASVSAATMVILYLEGYLDKLIQECNGDLTIFKDNYTITSMVFGEYSLSGTYPAITSLNADAPYMQCYTALENGTTKYAYPQEWVDAYKKFKDCSGELCNLLSSYEGVVRNQYGISSYIMGNVYYDALERVIIACYNYQDSKGKYVFRLHNVSTPNVTTTVIQSNTENTTN